MLRASLCAAATAMALMACPASAPAQGLQAHATAPDAGWIDLSIAGPVGASVAVTEVGPDGTHAPVTTAVLASGAAQLAHLVPWSCERLDRTFAATIQAADGSFESVVTTVATRPCRQRLSMAVSPFSPRARRRFVVRVRDRWASGGVAARLCLDPRRGRTRCRPVVLPPGRELVRLRVRARRPGLARLRLLTAWRGGSVGRNVDVRGRGRPLTLLATGDSMIQVVDSFLKRRLGRRGVRVRSDARISTGISKPAMLDWVRLARRQARSRRQTVAVVFIGANDGFPIGGVACCGEAWVKRYAARVRRMIAAYRRGGASRVYWLTLPTPSKPQFRRVFRGVNAALRLAEPSLAHTGRLIDTGAVFTPGGRFLSRWRQGDGVHLNVRGAARTASLIIDRLRRDGILG